MDDKLASQSKVFDLFTKLIIYRELHALKTLELNILAYVHNVQNFSTKHLIGSFVMYPKPSINALTSLFITF